jgi:glycosyltransferase involved in cell wall biosynthesis
MTHLFINGVAASAGGGLTYLRNVIPHLASRTDVKSTILLGTSLGKELGSFPNLCLVESASARGPARRIWQEQMNLPNLIRRSGAEILVSAGNFALRKCPVPQILLSRNSLYTSADFDRDLRARGEYGLRLDTGIKSFLAKRSLAWADFTVAPSQAFADDLRRWSGANVLAIPHGFDPDTFFADHTPLPADIQRRLVRRADELRLLFVSHYNYYRNFETLFRALPRLRERLRRPVKLFLTCRLCSGENPGAYSASEASALVRHLGIEDSVVELGSVPYRLLHHVYRAADLYVTPAYTESFAHPLVEAMASGLPVVASDLAVHREICGTASLYFDRFSSEELVERVLHLAGTPAWSRELADRGRRRARDFSWSQHVNRIVELARSLVESSAP